MADATVLHPARVVGGKMPSDCNQAHRFSTAQLVVPNTPFALCRQLVIDGGLLVVDFDWHQNTASVTYTNANAQQRSISAYVTFDDELHHVRVDSVDDLTFWLVVA